MNTNPLRSEEHTSELQSRFDLVCRLLLEKKNLFTLRMCSCGWPTTPSPPSIRTLTPRPPSPDPPTHHGTDDVTSLHMNTHALTAHPLICLAPSLSFSFFFFFNDPATTEIYTLSLHDALPISVPASGDTLRSLRRSARRA